MIKVSALTPLISAKQYEQAKQINFSGSSAKLSAPLQHDKFEYSEEGLTNQKLLSNGNYLEAYACNLCGINPAQFKDIKELHRYLADKTDELLYKTNETSKECLSVEEMEYEEWQETKRLSAKSALKKLNNETPVKKIIYCNSFLSPDIKDWYILPYDPKIAEETFKELEKLQTDNITNVYDSYKEKFLNQKNPDLKTYTVTDEGTSTIGIINKYGEYVGSVQVADNFEIKKDKISGDLKANKEAYIACLGIEGQYRHSRMSKKALEMMFEELTKYAKKQECDRLTLKVLTDNSRAVRGYIEKQGFMVVNFDIDDTVQKMEKPLSPNIIPAKEQKRRQFQTELFCEYVKMDKASQEKIHDALFNSKIYKSLSPSEKEFCDKYLFSRLENADF